MFSTSLRYNFNGKKAERRLPSHQTPLRQQGFGGHFVDAPPPYIEETKADNKIERVKKPVKKEKKKRKKKIKHKDIE
jgi:hypothetical protein|tara:strand:+ start:421 stop:651 length:231 start_codon:yes stop_codon:yes gene_type:complete